MTPINVSNKKSKEDKYGVITEYAVRVKNSTPGTKPRRALLYR